MLLMHPVQIQKIGSYYKKDKNGFLINPTSTEYISPHWRVVVDEAVNIYIQAYGDDLVAVYVRGSVAQGKATNGLSDLDTFAIVSEKNPNHNKYFDEQEERLKAKYGFLTGVEFDARTRVQLENYPILLIMGCCVYGNKLPDPKLKAGRQVIGYSQAPSKRLQKVDEVIDSKTTSSNIELKKEVCTWVMKILLRYGGDLAFAQNEQFSRDLYICYRDFSEYYPDKEQEMRDVLNLALNPVNNLIIVKDKRKNLGEFISQESERLKLY